VSYLNMNDAPDLPRDEQGRAAYAEQIRAAINPGEATEPPPLDASKLKDLTPAAAQKIRDDHHAAELAYTAFLVSKNGRDQCTPAEMQYLLKATMEQLRAEGYIR